MAALANSNISTTLVANTLQVSSRNVGYLCSNQHGRINKWSKYKPVIWPYVNVDNLPHSTQHRGQGEDGRCGFPNVQWMYALDVCRYYVDGWMNIWYYQPPTGGASAPYRLGDFRGYDHNAVPFIASGIKEGSSERVYTIAGDGQKTWYFTTYNTGSNVWISDFVNANIGLTEDARICAIVCEGDLPTSPTSSAIKEIVKGSKITDAHISVTVDFTPYNHGNMTVAFALCYDAADTEYLALPTDENNAGYIRVLVDRSVTPCTISISQLGFTDSLGTLGSATQPIANYQSQQNAFRIDERGTLEIYLTIYTPSGVTGYFIPKGENPFQFNITYTSSNSSGSTSAVINNLHIQTIDGQPFNDDYTTSSNTNVTVVLRNIDPSDALFPSNVADGIMTIRLTDNRYSTTLQNALDQKSMYVNMVPWS